MRPLAAAFAALLALLLPAASLQEATELGVVWVLAQPREAHAEACLRVGKAPTSTVVGLTGAAWDLAAMGKVAHALGQEIAEQPMPSCCVASMWCSDQGGCYTHALGPRYVNQGWLPGSEDRPVYTCQDKSGTSPSISKVVVDVKQQKALVVGSHLGRDNDAVKVSIAGETCSDPDICSGACQTCGPNLPCGDDQICLSSTTYGQSLNCYTYCAGPQDKSCPCGFICDSVTVIQAKGTVQRAIPTHLCTPKPFASANGAPCRDVPHESLMCEVPHYTALAADSSSAVRVSVAVPHAGAVGTYPLPPIQCASDANCDDKNACTVDRCDLGRSPPACVHTARPECGSQDQATLHRNRPFTYVLVALMSRNEQQEQFAEQIRENSKPNSLSDRDDAPLLHAKLHAPFPFFGNYYDEAWLNPNGLIQLPPHSSCSDVYGTIACITYSTESNTISVFGHNWDPSNSNAAKVYSDFPKSADALMHVLYDKVRPSGAQSSSSENTFSVSLYTDGSILNRYHTIRTTVTEADKVGLWGARTTSTQYYEESTPLQLVDNGIDTAFCLQSTLACVQNACVTKGDVLKLRWDGVSCAAIGEEFPILYECEFAGGAASTEADLDHGFLSCQVPDLSQIVPQSASTHVTTVKIRWTVPQAIVNFRTDGRQDVVGMLRDANGSNTMYTSLFIRYSLDGDRTECGCSAFEGLETATCDSCSVCNGVNSTVDCAGTCHGSAAVDRCGVCAGGTTGKFPGATCKTNPTIVTEDQIALLSQTLLLLLMLCCMTFTFASCKYFIQSAFHNSRRMDLPPPPGLLMLSTRRGLAAEEVENLPLVRFRSPSVDSTHSDGDEVDDVESSLVHAAASPSRAVQTECAICLQDFNEGDECRRLPCGHMFHVPCVDEWLQMSLLCPMCKRNIRDQL